MFNIIPWMIIFACTYIFQRQKTHIAQFKRNIFYCTLTAIKLHPHAYSTTTSPFSWSKSNVTSCDWWVYVVINSSVPVVVAVKFLNQKDNNNMFNIMFAKWIKCFNISKAIIYTR